MTAAVRAPWAPTYGRVVSFCEVPAPFGRTYRMAVVRAVDGREMTVSPNDVHQRPWLEFGDHVRLEYDAGAGSARWVARPLDIPTSCPSCWSRGWMQRNQIKQGLIPNGERCSHDWHHKAREAGLPATWTPRPCGEGEDE